MMHLLHTGCHVAGTVNLARPACMMHVLASGAPSVRLAGGSRVLFTSCIGGAAIICGCLTTMYSWSDGCTDMLTQFQPTMKAAALQKHSLTEVCTRG